MYRMSRTNVTENVLQFASDAGWTVRGRLIQRDGYEIYIGVSGFELVMKHPETGTEVVLYEDERFDTRSPYFDAIVRAIISNVESIAKESDKIETPK